MLVGRLRRVGRSDGGDNGRRELPAGEGGKFGDGDQAAERREGPAEARLRPARSQGRIQGEPPDEEAGAVSVLLFREWHGLQRAGVLHGRLAVGIEAVLRLPPPRRQVYRARQVRGEPAHVEPERRQGIVAFNKARHYSKSSHGLASPA